MKPVVMDMVESCEMEVIHTMDMDEGCPFMVLNPRGKRKLAKPMVTDVVKSGEMKVIHAVNMDVGRPLMVVSSPVHAGCPFMNP